MTLTKSNLVDSIQERLEVPRSRATRYIESLLELIKKNLETGEDVLISGFGKFSVKEKATRRGRNPQTGEDLVLDSRKIVTFKYSPVLREKMNGNE